MSSKTTYWNTLSFSFRLLLNDEEGKQIEGSKYTMYLGEGYYFSLPSLKNHR